MDIDMDIDEKKILILGSKGMLGGALVGVFPNAPAWDRYDVDAAQIEDLRLKIKDLETRPEVLINCVAYNDVDGAEDKKDLAHKLNVELPGNLAKLCKQLNIVLVHFSTNYVFDAEKGEYAENDEPSPKSAYAQSKHQGELAIAKNAKKYYLIRTAALFGPKGESKLSKKSFVDIMLELASKNDNIKAVSDEINSLTYAPDLAVAVKRLIESHAQFGTYHITNSGRASWYDFAKEIFRITVKKVNLEPVPSSAFPRKAQRPKKSVLMNTKLPTLRPWQEALKEFLSA